VVDLERLATAYYVTLENPSKNKNIRVEAIVELKPHIKPESARQAVQDVDALIAQVGKEKLCAA